MAGSITEIQSEESVSHKTVESIQFQYFKARPDTTPRDMGIKEAIKITIPIVGTAEEVARRLRGDVFQGPVQA